jgi:hypothetical protein
MGFWPLGWRASLKRGTHCAWVGLAATNTLLAATCAPATRVDLDRIPAADHSMFGTHPTCASAVWYPYSPSVIWCSSRPNPPSNRPADEITASSGRPGGTRRGRHESCCTFQGARTRSSGNNDAQVQGQRKLHIAHSTTSCSSPWADHHIQEFFAYSTKSCSNELQHGFLCLSLYLH